MEPGDVGDAPFDPWPNAQLHVEWGQAAALLAVGRGDAVVIVDVLSFSTTVSLAVDRGAAILALSRLEIEELGGPHTVAARFDAEVAGRRDDTSARFTLSPTSASRVNDGDRLVLTSLNGALAVAAARGGAPVLAGSLRNAQGAATASKRLLDRGVVRRVTLVACAEHWSSVAEAEGMRPALEDWLGAGAIAAHLRDLGARLSTEATAAAATFEAIGTAGLEACLMGCVSGRELRANGFVEDVMLASEVDVATTVPVVADDGFFRGYRPSQSGTQ